VTAGFGVTLTARPVAGAVTAAIPAIGCVSLAFGVWYAAAAWSVAPYPFQLAQRPESARADSGRAKIPEDGRFRGLGVAVSPQASEVRGNRLARIQFARKSLTSAQEPNPLARIQFARKSLKTAASRPWRSGLAASLGGPRESARADSVRAKIPEDGRFRGLGVPFSRKPRRSAGVGQRGFRSRENP
jgi:hypothetical protein